LACVTLSLVNSASVADSIKKSGAMKLEVAPLDISKKKKKILLTSDYVPYKNDPQSHFQEKQCILIKVTNDSPDEYEILPIPENNDLECEEQAWKSKDYTATRKFPGSSSYIIDGAEFQLAGAHPTETPHILTMVVVARVNDNPEGLPNEVEISIDEDHHPDETGGESHPGHGRYR
jgi:hypothetical protein